MKRCTRLCLFATTYDSYSLLHSLQLRSSLTVALIRDHKSLCLSQDSLLH